MSSRKEFVIEAEELLSEAEKLMLEIQESIQSGVDPDSLNALFRTIHTLKGISGLFGHEGLQNLCHNLENLLDDIRMGRVELNDDTVEFLFERLIFLKKALKEISKGKEINVDDEIEIIKNYNVKSKKASGKESLEKIVGTEILRVLSEYEEHRLRENIKKNKGIFIGYAVFALTDFDKSLKEITEKLKKDGELIATLPTSENIPDGSIGFKLLFASDK